MLCFVLINCVLSNLLCVWILFVRVVCLFVCLFVYVVVAVVVVEYLLG